MNRKDTTALSVPVPGDAQRGPLSMLVAMTGLRFTAWVTERATDAELRILHCRKLVTEGRGIVQETEWETRRRIAIARRQAEEEEAEGHLGALLRQASAGNMRQILGSELEKEKLLLERSLLRRLQRAGLPPPAPQPVSDLPPSANALEVHVSDQQIEAMALKAIARFGTLERDEAERAWATWRQELERRFPRYAALEIAARAEELRRIAR